MTYEVLARRLRPQRFEEVVGQGHVTRTLQAAIAADRVAHAFLFTGPRGVGKTTIARLLAKALNCAAGPTPTPCSECASCTEIAGGGAFDVLEIDGASHTQVDKVRELMETVAHRPLRSRFKIFIIDEVHMLSQHSFNALLKTLEEPPPHVKFIFATTDPHKVLATVTSRCQRYDLARIGVAELRTQLMRIADDEGGTLDDDAATLLAREAEGSLRDAQSLLEQLLSGGQKAIDVETVRTVVGAADRRLVVALAAGVLARDPAACLAGLRELQEHGYDAQRCCRDLLEHFRNLVVLRATDEPSVLADLPDVERSVVAEQAAVRSLDDLHRCFDLLLRADETLSVPARTVDPLLVLEVSLVRMATLEPLLPMDEVLRRLDGLGSPSSGGSVSTPSATRSARGGGRASGVAGGLWQELLARVQREKVGLYMALAAGRLLSLDEGTLRIGIENEAIRRDLLRRETLDRLGTLAGEISGRTISVDIVPLPREHAHEAPLARARQEQEETRSDPVVQAAAEIFEAEVRSVRSRRGPERGRA